MGEILIAFAVGCLTGYLPEKTCEWYKMLAQWLNDLLVFIIQIAI